MPFRISRILGRTIELILLSTGTRVAIRAFTNRFHDLEDWTYEFWLAYPDKYPHPEAYSPTF
jgi:hypothetical protein